LLAKHSGASEGVRASQPRHGGWQAPLLDQESGNALFERARSMDALLLGRKTYEIFADYWPAAPEEIPFTGLLNGVPKYVASRTLAGGGTIPTALRLTESVTYPNGTLQLAYETAGTPTYGNLAD
jgi:dihydrofolate reductase